MRYLQYCPKPCILRAVVLAGMALPALLPLSASAAPAVATQQGRAVDIPFGFDPLLQPQIVVQARVNGSEPMPFVVDTGLGEGVMIDSAAARGIGLAPAAGQSGAAAGEIRLSRAAITSFALVGEMGAAPVPIPGIRSVAVGDLSRLMAGRFRTAAAGVIGVRALESRAIAFDFGARTMRIYPAGARPLPAGSLPIVRGERDGRYTVRAMLQPGVSADLLVDTGSETTCLPMSGAARLQPLASAVSGAGTAYGLFVVPRLLLRELALGPIVLRRVSVDTLPQSPAGFPLGLDVLAAFRVVIDFPHRTMALARRTANLSLPIAGYTGASIAPAEHGLTISDVDRGSPAARAGLRPGDTVERIDGNETGGMPMLMARRMLDGFSGSTARLRVRRQGGTIDVALLRRSEFDRPALPADGLFLSIAPHGPATILALARGCAAERAGARPGDRVTAINGLDLADASAGAIGVEIRRRRLALRVLRSGGPNPLRIEPVVPENVSRLSLR